MDLVLLRPPNVACTIGFRPTSSNPPRPLGEPVAISTFCQALRRPCLARYWRRSPVLCSAATLGFTVSQQMAGYLIWLCERARAPALVNRRKDSVPLTGTLPPALPTASAFFGNTQPPNLVIHFFIFFFFFFGPSSPPAITTIANTCCINYPPVTSTSLIQLSPSDGFSPANNVLVLQLLATCTDPALGIVAPAQEPHQI